MLLPTMPWRAGYVPVTSVAAFTRVDVGKMEWLLVVDALGPQPSDGRRVAGLMLSGRSPSTTKIAIRRSGSGAVCPHASRAATVKQP